MTHLDELRCMELGLGIGLEPTAEEAEHLAACPSCAAALEAERGLSEALAAVPQVEVPAGFAMRTRTRFGAEIVRRRRVQLAWGLGAAMALAPVALAVLVAGVFDDLGSFLNGVGVAVAMLATWARVSVVVLRAMPLLAMMLTAATGTALLIWTAMLVRLARERPRTGGWS